MLDETQEQLAVGALEEGPGSDDIEAKSNTSPMSRVGTIAALAGATAACGGGGGDSGGTPPIAGGGGSGGAPVGGSPPTTLRKPETDEEAARFILHASLSASEGQIAAVKEEGYEPWLSAQMASPNDLTGAQFMQSRGFETVGNRAHTATETGDRMIWNQLLSGGNGVRKRTALALSEFFVVSLSAMPMVWPSSAIAAYWDTLNEHAFGNFRELLEAITLNPAMGAFLNTRGNQKADPASGRVPDENFGREVMQLFTIGLYELNPDGTLKAGADGKPIETYDNDDVTGIAKAFTGYDFDYQGITYTTDPGFTRQIEDPVIAYRPMTADSTRWKDTRLAGRDFHSDEEKSFLGTTIPAGTGAAETLRITLDTLFNHPNVGPFFGKQMIQRLVTSNPSPAYVRRVSAAFDNNGSGVRGDLKAVFKAVLLDEEALSNDAFSSTQFGKLREPMLKFVQWGRTFGAQSESDAWDIPELASPTNELGQSPLRSPSVFNFFRPGYVPLISQTSAAGLVAPEMQLVNETSVAGYVNFMEAMIAGQGGRARDVKATYSQELPIAHDTTALVDRLDLLLTAGQLNDDTRSTIINALEARPVTQSDSDDNKLRRIHAAVFLVMISNDYSVQR